MTARKSWTIWCDRCGESDGSDLGAETARERRRELMDQGWKVNQLGGRDYCEGCK